MQIHSDFNERMAEQQGTTTTGVSHLVLIPWLARGHLIPMLDIARLLADAGSIVTVVTTSANASGLRGSDMCSSSGCLRYAIIPFPCPAITDLPEGCENVDRLPSRQLAGKFYSAAKLLRPSLESVLRGLAPPPSAIIFGIGFPWLASLARDALPVPRFVFHGFSSFTLLASHNLHAHKTHERAGSPTDTLILPGLPHRVEIQRSRLPIFFDRASEIHSVYVEMRDGEVAADGFVVNSFEELEQGYAALLAMAAGKKVWSVGPVSLCNRESADVASRGGRSFSVDVDRCVKWLDSRERGSVVYVSFGSMGRLDAEQTRELGLGLMASGWPFVWVIREGAPPPPPEVEKTMEESGLVIRGWAPQTILLAHSAVGGFLTHCGWNSVMEGVVAGVPMATWPLGADQFLNEKLVVEVLRLGVEVRGRGASGELMVKREEVKRVVEELMVRGPEGDQRRKRSKDFADKARTAMEDRGASQRSLVEIIHDVANWRAYN